MKLKNIKMTVRTDLKAPTVSCSIRLAGRSFQSLSVFERKLYLYLLVLALSTINFFGQFTRRVTLPQCKQALRKADSTSTRKMSTAS